jgi:ATP/maltotriose-dependent transcriptional regulator MalT
MGTQTDHLVGRAEELGSLARALAELDRGRSIAILLVGEPGIGKTRLLTEFGARADAEGNLVLSGSASELERDLPFSLFVDALDEYVRGLDPELVAHLDDDVRTELGHVFPSLTTLAGGRPAALQHERYRSHRAVRALLEQLASAQPLVLVLDDLHWADPASIELLGALLRRPPSAPVLLALASRPLHVPERLSAALERASRAEQITRIELGALSAEEARELLGDVGDRVDPDVLYVESGGNPFYLEQLARAGGGTAVYDEASLAGIGVPATVAAALAEELGLLSETQRLVLEGAAVAGDPFEPELAAPSSAVSESTVMEALDGLLRVDLLRTTDVPRRFRFRHPLVRRAVYEAAAPGWRLGAHERCAESLAARGAPATRCAHHVERSAREGDAEAVAVLREAGEEAARLAPASAAHWFAEALRLQSAKVPAGERIELLFARARALTATGRFDESRSALVEALEIVPAGEAGLLARLSRACAGVETNLGLQEQAHDRLARALEELPDQSSREAVALMLELMLNALWRTKHEEMHAAAERAVQAARRLGDIPMTAAALAELALADSLMGDAGKAEANHAEAAALVDSLPDDQLAGHLEAGAWLAGVELYLDRYAEGELHANRALAVARATGQGELFLLLVATLGGLLRQRGKLAESAELLDGGIEAARLLGNSHALRWTLLGRSAAALRTGDTDLALATAQESVDLSQSAEISFHSAEGAADLAAALLETGEPERAVELLLESSGGEELALIAGSPRARYLEVLTQGWLALDRHAEAERAATTARAWASSVQLPMAAAWAERASAAVELEGGDPERAAERALASAAAADEAGAPVEGALSRLLAGRALAQAGERQGAVAQLRRAAHDFRESGAPRYCGKAERELRKLGHRIQKRTRPGGPAGTALESLTERELQLAMLVVDRKTNPEIADELFLSQKTVETHLRNIFRKVGVSTRVELARAVERAQHATGTPS